MLAWAVAAAMLGVLLMDERKQAKQPVDASRAKMIALIRAEARKQGVPDPIALAFAEVESGFNPRAAGDLGWSEKRPALYRSLVLDNPKMAQNPARTDARAWHSYGLFQLLAPHHVRPAEHPEILYDPQVNAQRGIGYIKALLKKHGDDVTQARLAYAGALKVPQAEQDRVLIRFTRAYQKWHDADAQGLA